MEWDAQHQRADGEKAVIQDVEDHTRSLNRGLDRGEAGADDDKDDSYDDERKAGRAAPPPPPPPPPGPPARCRHGHGGGAERSGARGARRTPPRMRRQPRGHAYACNREAGSTHAYMRMYKHTYISAHMHA